MDHEDQIEKILGGLPEEYKTMIDHVESRDTPPSLAELHEKMINQEAKLQTAIASVPPAPVTANYTNYRGSNNNRSNNSRRGGHRGGQTWQQHQQVNSSSANNPRQSTPRGYQGRCQLCGVFGHSARTCNQNQSAGNFPVTQTQLSPMNQPWQPRATM